MPVFLVIVKRHLWQFFTIYTGLHRQHRFLHIELKSTVGQLVDIASVE